MLSTGWAEEDGDCKIDACADWDEGFICKSAWAIESPFCRLLCKAAITTAPQAASASRASARLRRMGVMGGVGEGEEVPSLSRMDRGVNGVFEAIMGGGGGGGGGAAAAARQRRQQNPPNESCCRTKIAAENVLQKNVFESPARRDTETSRATKKFTAFFYSKRLGLRDLDVL